MLPIPELVIETISSYNFDVLRFGAERIISTKEYNFNFSLYSLLFYAEDSQNTSTAESSNGSRNHLFSVTKPIKKLLKKISCLKAEKDLDTLTRSRQTSPPAKE